MAKLKNDPVSKADLQNFLALQSDFSFEMKILHKLTGLGFACLHSGTYDDPVTKKPREFDIRAYASRYGIRFLRLAVECKNVRENYPLLLSCVPRRKDEAFSDLMIATDKERFDLLDWSSSDFEDAHRSDLPVYEPTTRTFSLTNSYSRYRENDPVAKTCEQVGRQQSNDFPLCQHT